MPISGEVFHYWEITGLYRETPGYVGRVGRSDLLAFQQREKSVKYATIYYESLEKSQNTLIYYIQNKKFRYLIIYHANL